MAAPRRSYRSRRTRAEVGSAQRPPRGADAICATSESARNLDQVWSKSSTRAAIVRRAVSGSGSEVSICQDVPIAGNDQVMPTSNPLLVARRYRAAWLRIWSSASLNPSGVVLEPASRPTSRPSIGRPTTASGTAPAKSRW